MRKLIIPLIFLFSLVSLSAQTEPPFEFPLPSSFPGTLPDGVVDRLGFGIISDVAVSPSEDLIAIAASTGVYIYEPDIETFVRMIETGAFTGKLIWSPDGEQILVSSRLRETLDFWDVFTGELVSSINSGRVYGIDWSPDGRWIAAGTNDGRIKIWDLSSKSLLFNIKSHHSDSDDAFVGTVEISSAGLLASSSGTKVVVWDLISNELKYTLERKSYPSWSPDGKKLIVSEFQSRTLGLLDAETGDLIDEYTFEEFGFILRTWWSKDGTRLAVASYTSDVFVLDVNNWEVLQKFEEHTYGSPSLAWLNDRGELISSGGANTVIKWDIDSGNAKKVLRGTPGVSHLRWSPDNSTLATNSGRDIIFWDIKQTSVRNMIELFRPDFPNPAYGAIFRAEFTEGGRAFIVLAGDDSKGFAAYDWRSGQRLSFRIRMNQPIDFTLSPDGFQIATIPLMWAGNELAIWDISSYEMIKTNIVEDASYISWSPDGQRIAISSGPKLSILDTNSWEVKLVLENSSSFSNNFSWSPDGTKIVLGTFGGNVLIWDVEDEAVIYKLLDDELSIDAVTWSPDGKFIASAWNIELPGADFQSYPSQSESVVAIWDATTGERVRTLEGFWDITSLSFNPTNSLLAMGSSDGTIWLIEP